MDTKEQEALFGRLLDKQVQQHSHAYMRYHVDGQPTNSDNLFNLLGLDTSLLTEDGLQLLQYLENRTEMPGVSFQYDAFKWKVEAFLALQDIFSIPVVAGATGINPYQIMYFYYESKYILAESIIGGLNGLHIINKQALRNVLEFNLLQNYFFSITRNEGSYQRLSDYLGNRINRSITKLLDKALPAGSFCKPIKKRIQLDLENLSNRYSHAYIPADSPKHYGIFTPDTSFESMYFYVHISAVLDVVLWMYYVNFPTLFFPVDIVRKFGFNPPMGLFVTPSTTGVLQKATPGEDFTLFKEYAASKPVIADLQKLYNTEPTLSDEALWATWTDERGEGDTLASCWAKMMAGQRVTHEMLAVRSRLTVEGPGEYYEEMDKGSDTYLSQYTAFATWRKIYKKIE